MSSEKKRVQFRAPNRLIDRADALAAVLGEDRTDILVTALREYLQEATHDDALTQEIAAAYYDDEITLEELKALVGAEEAANLQVLKRQLDEAFLDEVADA
jgi:ubiquinone biosynthesis protein UbiJ